MAFVLRSNVYRNISKIRTVRPSSVSHVGYNPVKLDQRSVVRSFASSRDSKQPPPPPPNPAKKAEPPKQTQTTAPKSSQSQQQPQSQQQQQPPKKSPETATSISTSGLKIARTREELLRNVGLRTVEGSYAKLLYQTAEKRKEVDIATADVSKIVRQLPKDPKLERLLLDPTVSKVDRAAGIAKLEGQFSKLVVQFLLHIVTTKKYSKTALILKKYMEIVETLRGDITVTVTLAKESKPQEIDWLKRKFSQSLKPVGQLKLALKVDPLILGGVKVDIGGEYFLDASLQTELDKMHQQMISTVDSFYGHKLAQLAQLRGDNSLIYE